MAFGVDMFVNGYFLVWKAPSVHFALSVWVCLKFLVWDEEENGRHILGSANVDGP